MSTVAPDPSDPRAFLRALFDAAVARAQPSQVLAGQLPAPPRGRTLVIGAGKTGPITARLQTAFFDIVNGKNDKYRQWLAPVAA